MSKTNIKILVTEPDEISKEAILMLKKHKYEVVDTINDNNRLTVSGLFIRSYTSVNKEYLKQFPNLKLILRAGVGLDNIDLEECELRKIRIFHSPGSNTQAVAEYVIGMILLKMRNIQSQSDLLYNKLWRDRAIMGSQLSGKTVGLVGCGAIGKSIAKLLEPFKVTILGYDPYVDENILSSHKIIKTTFKKVIQEADVISVQIPLTKNNIDMFSKDQFIIMKPNSILINISRGGLVNEKDLVWALNHNVIGGAVLDVFTNEPDIYPRLHSARNLYLTPHIAGFTKESDIEMATGAVTNYLQYATAN